MINLQTIERGTAFDYAAVSPKVEAEVRAVAQRIRVRHQQHIEAMLETGRDLLGVRDSLPHGRFGAWLSAEFGWAERTAQNYMQAARTFGDKSAIVADLPAKTVYEIASAPDAVKQEVIAKLDAGEKLDPGAVRSSIREAREKEKKQAALAKLPEKKRKAVLRSEARRHVDQEAFRQQREESRRREDAAAIEVVEWLRSRLGDDLETFAQKLGAAPQLKVIERILKRLGPNQRFVHGGTTCGVRIEAVF